MYDTMVVILCLAAVRDGLIATKRQLLLIVWLIKKL